MYYSKTMTDFWSKVMFDVPVIGHRISKKQIHCILGTKRKYDQHWLKSWFFLPQIWFLYEHNEKLLDM